MAKIKAAFKIVRDGIEPSTSPPAETEIVHFCPGILNSYPTQASHVTQIGGTIRASRVRIHNVRRTSFDTSHGSRIDGQKWSTHRSPENGDQVTRTLQEDELGQEGIPSRFKAAILFKHAGLPILATMTVETETSGKLAIF
jgi:hypothetical protein